MRALLWPFARLLTLVLVVAPGAAWAQTPSSSPPIRGSAEVVLGISIDSLTTDVNAAPACASLAAPCTHDRPSRFGGFGLDVGVSGALGDRLALTGRATISAYGWDSAAALVAHGEASNVVRAIEFGPTFRSPFSQPHGLHQESDRVFVDVLAGVEDNSICGAHPVVEIMGGIDSFGPWGSGRGRPWTLRIAIGYRASPGSTYPVSGLRFLFAVVAGPHR